VVAPVEARYMSSRKVCAFGIGLRRFRAGENWTGMQPR